MFGIKLVGPNHLHFPFFGKAAKPVLINFPDSPEGRSVAERIPIGHRALVYLMHPVKHFGAAIEYIQWDFNGVDVLEQGRRAALSQDAVTMMEAVNPRFARVWRCVRLLALVDDPMKAPTPEFGFQEGEIMRDIEKQQYFDMFNAVPWTWTDSDH
jgi:hypothetical protein